jgi:hypothetical protein
MYTPEQLQSAIEIARSLGRSHDTRSLGPSD